MRAEIVMIGTELLLGQIVDTNATYIGKILAENGINLFQKTTVGDNRDRIVRVLDAGLDRADAILTSGGLGPTEDDLTRDCIAEVTGRPLEFRHDLYEQLAERFARVRRPMTENNKKQAYAPRGATAVPNPNGTAPGLIVEGGRGVIIAMPGVPTELHAMLADNVIPYLRERFELAGLLRYRVLKVCGIGESRVDAAIGDLLNSMDNPKVGLLASPDAVKIRISARANTLDEATALIDKADARIRERLPGLIMGVDDDTLEGVVDGLLTERGWSLAVGETHTGGMMAQRLTVAGAACFVGAVVRPTSHFAGRDCRSAAVEWAQAVRAQHSASAGLALVADLARRRAVAAFCSPGGTANWDVSFARPDELNQLRSVTICLERLRRYLAGVVNPAHDPRT
jgi:nicotinamide-nucleotide amidase